MTWTSSSAWFGCWRTLLHTHTHAYVQDDACQYATAYENAALHCVYDDTVRLAIWYVMVCRGLVRDGGLMPYAMPLHRQYDLLHVYMHVGIAPASHPHPIPSHNSYAPARFHSTSHAQRARVQRVLAHRMRSQTASNRDGGWGSFACRFVDRFFRELRKICKTRKRLIHSFGGP